MKAKLAFTLIELLVVIAVIGILSGLIVVSMSGVTDRATIAKAQIFSNSLRNSLMLNLISEWKLNGDTNDSWSGGNNGTGNNITSISDCIQGTCYYFNAINNSYINILHNSNLKPTNKITVSVWASSLNWGGYSDARIISCSEGGGYNITPSGNSTTAWVYINGGYRSPAFFSTPPKSGWHYFVFSFDGRYLKTYFNGVYANQFDAGAVYPIYYLHNNSLFIGAEAGSGSVVTGNYFTGNIDEVRIYNDSVPISMIKEQYYLGLNSLFTNDGITKEEYLSRIEEIASK